MSHGEQDQSWVKLSKYYHQNVIRIFEISRNLPKDIFSELPW